MPIHEYRECFMFEDAAGTMSHSLCVDCVSSSLGQRFNKGGIVRTIPHQHDPFVVSLVKTEQRHDKGAQHQRLGIVYCMAYRDHVIHPDCVIECPNFHKAT